MILVAKSSWTVACSSEQSLSFSNTIRITFVLKNGVFETGGTCKVNGGRLPSLHSEARKRKHRGLPAGLSDLPTARPWVMSSSVDVEREAGVVTTATGQHHATNWSVDRPNLCCHALIFYIAAPASSVCARSRSSGTPISKKNPSTQYALGASWASSRTRKSFSKENRSGK
jgi:hypothetical protein